MICRWCDNDNVLGRRMCPHCGQDTKRPDDDTPDRYRDDDEERTFQRIRATLVEASKSLAVSGVAVLILVVGAKAAYGAWPLTVWPRSVPSYEASPGASASPVSPSTVAAASICSAETGSVTDMTGQSYSYWSCPVEGGGNLYRTPGASAELTGYLRLSPSWFVCQALGETDPQTGGSTWLYTQGDDRYLDDGWGYIAAGLVSSSWTTGPVPDLPTC